MRIVFLGDSITDASRYREFDDNISSYGIGYVRTVAGTLLTDEPNKYEIINRGVSGDRSVDAYGRIKRDVWELKPDVLSIFIGVNDVWHEINKKNGVDVERFERFYKMIIDDTRKLLPDIKIILIEPYVVKGCATEEKWDEFLKVKDYAVVVKKIAKQYGFPIVETQEMISKAQELYNNLCISDGVHPQIVGATLIGREWIKVFKKHFDK